MKISSYMNNMNPIIEKNDAKVQKENKQANEKHTMEQSVKLSISNDGMEHYRKHIQQNGQESYDDILQRRELLKSGKISDVDYGYEISKKAAELNKDAANAGQNALSTTDRANGYVAAYAELYDEIVQGYESGYERRLPDAVKDLQVPRRDWEVCMTIPENQWGYHKDWSLSYVKKTVESIGYIVHAVSMGKIWL